MPYTFVDLGYYIYTKFRNALWRPFSIVPSKNAEPAEPTIKLVAEPTLKVVIIPTGILVLKPILIHVAYNIYTKFRNALWCPCSSRPSKGAEPTLNPIADLIVAANVDLISTNKFCYSTVILLPIPNKMLAEGNSFYHQLWFFVNKDKEDDKATYFIYPWLENKSRTLDDSGFYQINKNSI